MTRATAVVDDKLSRSMATRDKPCDSQAGFLNRSWIDTVVYQPGQLFGRDLDSGQP